MGVEQFAVLLLDAQRGSHISVTALLQVGLKEQALHLAASGLLLTLNLVKGELKGAAGGQPGLEECELDSGGGGAGRSCSCDCHIPTVYLL
jgi:hypothetical protein